MKTNENLSKIVSRGTAFVLCFAILAFALTALCWGAALPAQAHTACTPSSSPTFSITSPTSASGPVGTSVTVTASGIQDSTCTANFNGPGNLAWDMSSCSNAPTTISNVTITSGGFTNTFNWPTAAATVDHQYVVCLLISTGSNTPVLTSSNTFKVSSSSSSSASVSVDSSSYKVGDTMTVTGTGFLASTSVTVKLQSSNGTTTTTLGNVTTDITGAFTQDYTVPAHPLNSVVVKATAGSVTATSSSFTVKAKTTAKPKPKPTPAPTSAPPPPTYFPPAGLASTPTPVPTATDTPTAVPTDTPTPVPSPTVAPVPTPVQAVVNHNTSAGILGGRLPVLLAIGLGMLIALGLLFVVGRLLLRKFLSPAPLTNLPPSGAPPWNLSQDGSLQANNMGNGVPFAQTMPFDSPYQPGNGGFAPDPGYVPQQVPFNAPFGPGNGGFAPVPDNSPFGPGNGGFGPGPGNSQQPVPLGGPYQPGNSGFAPANVPQQEPFPPNNWFPPPN